MTNQIKNLNDKKPKYDLEERTAKFGRETIRFVARLTSSPINLPLISQIVRSATSIGANYMEADAAESKKDFQHKIAICRKESKETIHWFRMITEANPLCQEQCQKLSREAHEFVLIFSAILKSSRMNLNSKI